MEKFIRKMAERIIEDDRDAILFIGVIYADGNTRHVVCVALDASSTNEYLKDMLAAESFGASTLYRRESYLFRSWFYGCGTVVVGCKSPSEIGIVSVKVRPICDFVASSLML